MLKEAYADGIAGAVEAYWNWQTSRAGKRAGKRVGFPRFKRKGRDQDRVSFTTGAMRVEPDRRHLTLPVIGTVRTHENTRRIERLIKAGRARVLAISVRRNGTRLDASVRVLVQRPQQPKVVHPGSRVGVDVGVRRLATVATADGTAIEQVENHDRSAPRCASYATCAGPVRVARKVHGATVSAPLRFPGCIAGSTMSAPITCTS